MQKISQFKMICEIFVCGILPEIELLGVTVHQPVSVSVRDFERPCKIKVRFLVAAAEIRTENEPLRGFIDRLFECFFESARVAVGDARNIEKDILDREQGLKACGERGVAAMTADELYLGVLFYGFTNDLGCGVLRVVPPGVKQDRDGVFCG